MHSFFLHLFFKEIKNSIPNSNVKFCKTENKRKWSLPKRDSFNLASWFSQKFGPTASNKHAKKYEIKTKHKRSSIWWEVNKVLKSNTRKHYIWQKFCKFYLGNSIWNLQCNRFCKWNWVKCMFYSLIDVTMIFI